MAYRMSDDAPGRDGSAAIVRNALGPVRGFGFKRLFDVVVATAALIFTAPLILLTAVLIRLQDGERALFAQTRYGANGRPFRCYKLRSMVPDAAARLKALLETDPVARAEWDASEKLSNDPRITPLGNFIRKTSIDELPQLINVIRGDMSIVGPRPIQHAEIARYGEHYEAYTRVRPGLTGLWQISGRSETTYAERVALDVAYVNTRTFWGDIAIILRTIPAVLGSRGAK